MSRLKSVALLTLLFAVQAACTKQAVYENARNESRWDCGKLPLSQQAECREQSSVSYQEYERERQALLKSQAPSTEQ